MCIYCFNPVIKEGNYIETCKWTRPQECNKRGDVRYGKCHCNRDPNTSTESPLQTIDYNFDTTTTTTTTTTSTF